MPQAILEATKRDAEGGTNISTNPCNEGARQEWFQIDGTAPAGMGALYEITKMLAGIPHAVNCLSKQTVADRAVDSELALPELRIHEHAFFSIYEAGVQYHRHLDSYGGSDNSRMLTILTYMNREWDESMGGQLRVYDEQGAHDKSKDEGEYVDYAPLEGRVILFKSESVSHAVLPANFKRFCIQIWSHGSAIVE